jgi:hypothetical protein
MRLHAVVIKMNFNYDLYPVSLERYIYNTTCVAMYFFSDAVVMLTTDIHCAIKAVALCKAKVQLANKLSS